MIGIGIAAVVAVGIGIMFATGMFSSKPAAPPAARPPASSAPSSPAPATPVPAAPAPATPALATPAPATPAPATPAPATPATPATGAAAGAAETPDKTAAQQAAPSAPVVAPPPAQPAPPRGCGPIDAPERLSVLPPGVTLSPLDLVCVAKRWVGVGRPGDAVLLLTRALQESPNRVFGPASLELARLYDPQRETPNWPPNAAYAAEKYQDAINDSAFPEVQAQARIDLEKLQKAQ